MSCARLAAMMVASATLGASACAPATFDNITNAEGADGTVNPREAKTVPDRSLLAPRPVAPISASWVNTSRPKLRWAPAPGSTGALVELSRTRDFHEKKSFVVVHGSELALPEDLDKGIWYWRLTARSEGAVGENPSPTWELLVRGPSAHGASEAPNGGLLDVNGDGEPDLNVVVLVKAEKAGDPPTPVAFTLFGSAVAGYDLFSEKGAIGVDVGQPDVSLTGGTDFDGDGFADYAMGDVWKDAATSETFGDILLVYGAANGVDANKNRDHGWVEGPLFQTIPGLAAAGDINGDGYGDLSTTLPDLGFATLGGAAGLNTMVVFSREDPKLSIAPVAGGCDLDGDGLADVAVASADPTSPIRWARGARDHFETASALTIGSAMKIPSRAIALASGDFDGDAVTDVAFSTIVEDKPAVCVHSTKTTFSERSCWFAPTGTTPGGFGLSLAAGDLDADGQDEIIVASTAGLVVLAHQGGALGAEGTSFVATDVAGSFAPRVTMIHPGRPSMAKWAAYSADGRVLTVFTGTKIAQTIDLSNDPYFTKFGVSLR